MDAGRPAAGGFFLLLLRWVRTGGSVCEGGSAFLPVERLVANKAGGASLCQRRQPPKAGAEGQRLQRLVPPATIGPALGGLTTLDMPTIAYDAEWRTKVAGGNKPPPTLNSEEPFIFRYHAWGWLSAGSAARGWRWRRLLCLSR
jgi:hypothetical protein